jgi:hypothetical protein
MIGIVAPIVVVALFGAILGGLTWIAARAQRRGGGASLMGPFEEIWQPAAHRARLETQVQNERPAPAPLPGDRLL